MLSGVLDKFKELLKKQLLLTITFSLIIGLILGLVYGYFVNPVEWVNAPMEVVRQDLQEDYLRMAIEAYQIHKNDLLALTRWGELGSNATVILDKIKYSPGDLGWEAVYEFEKVVTIRDARPIDIECETVSPGNNALNLLLWGGTTLLVIGLGAFFYFRSNIVKTGAGAKSMPVLKEWEAVTQLQSGNSTTNSGGTPFYYGLEKEKAKYLKNPPLANHIWTFIMGDDQYEESCSVDTKKGDFLGECGIEIAKTIENSSPKRPTAFDIWLFDKNEINTRSMILMSHNAYENELLRAQFEMKGKPVLAEIGKEIDIQTDHLLMRVRILDMICAQNEPGRCEYFQRLSLDVNIWKQ